MNFLKVLLTLTLILSISSCSNTPVVQDFSTTSSATEEYGKFESDLKTASEKQVNVLSPKNFSHAEEYLKDAQKSLNNQKDAKDTLQLVAKGRAYLNRANQFAQVSRSNLGEVINARQQAIAAGASQIYASEFKKIDADLQDVTSDIENNKLKSSVVEKSPLQLAYLDIELRAIKHTNLTKPRNVVDQANKEGAKEFAPRSLAIAEKSIQEFDAYITANRHETAGIARKNAETQKAADHLLKITRSSKSGDKTTSEDMALKMESEQNKVANQQTQLEANKDQLASKDSRIAEGRNANQVLLAKNTNLESDQAFNEQFEQARAEFSESEAEVYKQGNSLMIRLKGLEFPSAQAELKGSNFALLAKVQKVINSFEHGTIIVEGHTDSLGGKKINEQLSANRAKAVKEYFVANNQGDSLDIKSLGYDYQKPLASNKTAEGRAKNRRVDVIITAENN